MHGVLKTVTLLLVTAWTSAAGAQGYPDKPIRILIGFPAGSTVDILARPIATRMTEILGQQVVIDNRAGATGIIASEFVVRAPADGYTLLATPGSALNTSPHLHAHMTFDVLRDLAPVVQIGAFPNVLFVHPNVPAKSVKELIDLARARPGVLTFGSAGFGSGLHLAGELFKSIAKIDIVHIPYKGVGLALPDMVAGKIQMVFYPPTFLSFVKEGKLRAITIAAPSRSTLLPEVPTSAEAGMPELIASSWHAVVAPAGVPPEHIKKLYDTLKMVMADKEVREKMGSVGADPVGSSPEQFAPFMRTEVDKWRKVIKTSGVTVD